MPHIVCSTFALLDLIRVPLPAARTAAKTGLSGMNSGDSYPLATGAGAAGFEPAIPGPKPGALPLGHAPTRTAPLRDAARTTASIPKRPPTVRWLNPRPALGFQPSASGPTATPGA